MNRQSRIITVDVPVGIQDGVRQIPGAQYGIFGDYNVSSITTDDPTFDQDRSRVYVYKMLIGMCVLLQAVACITVAGIDLMASPNGQSTTNATLLDIRKCLNFIFTLESIAGVTMFIFSITWFC